MTDTLDSSGLKPTQPNWLSSAEACDIYFSATYPHEAHEAISSILNNVKIDFHIQRTKFRQKKILIADMDSTIITSETIDKLATIAGFGPEVASITKRSMKGELNFSEAVQDRVAMLSGLSIKAIDHILAEIKISKGAKTLVRTMKANGAFTVLVSGGFRNFSEPIANIAGFDQNYANRLGIKKGLLTGKVIKPILGPDSKRKILTTKTSQLGTTISETLAIGDGANDIEMIQAAGLGIAYRGKQITRNAALANLHSQSSGACIDYADLTAALFFQGYHRKEFIENK